MRSKTHKLCREPNTGIYYARIQVGNVRRRFTFGKSRKPAEADLRRLERDISAGLVLFEHKNAVKKLQMESGDDLLLSELIEVHLEWLAVHRAEKTYSMRKHYVETFLEFNGDCMVSELNRVAIENFFAWAKTNHSKSKNGGNVFVRNIKTLLLWGDEIGLYRCPIRKFPATPETLPEMRRFTDDELKKLLARIPEEFSAFKDLIIFAILTGLRPKELRELRRDQLMQDADGDYYIFIQTHKTSRSAHEPSPRSVPLCPVATEIMKRQIAGIKKSSLVFLNDDGKPYTQRTLHSRLRRWCKRAGIRERSPYSLRHTFGSLQAEANINQTCISQVMGHTTGRTVARYIANNAEHHKKGVCAIESRIINLQ